MKNPILIIFTLFFSNYLSGQFKPDTFIVNNSLYENSSKPLKDGYYWLTEDKILIKKGFIKNGYPDGIWYYYYPTGKLQAEIEYKQIEERCIVGGICNYYYPNGIIESTEQYSIFTGDSIACQDCFEFDTISDLFVPIPWVKYTGSIPIGIGRQYYENGNLKREIYYVPILYFDFLILDSKYKKINNKWIIDYPRNFMASKTNFYNEQGIFIFSR